MPRRALVICRDEIILESSETALSNAGYEVTRATQREFVFKALLSLQPELVILDLDLPGNSVADVLHWIGNQRPRPALLLVSSGESLGLMREGFIVPDFQLLIKPLGQDEMKEAVTRASRQTREASSVRSQGT